eukprot:TRINITY_DN34525_c0_g1_i1.p1 TRINITY_DN34525_c0_g1~~TRINITY_DN34525_c0_g1_i1.p1  ORF type:complete len:501 (+),score=57.07 TRINITY_DN34525_c0_g1_i1:62-1564(+)
MSPPSCKRPSKAMRGLLMSLALLYCVFSFASAHVAPAHHDPHASGKHAHNDHAGHDHHGGSPCGSALSVVLLGMVTVMMVTFHLVNYPDKDIQSATWRIISQTLSVFCAVISYTAIKGTTKMIFMEPAENHHGPPDFITLVFHVIRFCAIGAGFYPALNALRGGCEWRFHAFGHLGGHLMAFAAIDIFGNLQQLRIFSSSPTMALMAVVVAAIAFIIAVPIVNSICLKYIHDEHYNHQVQESEDDAVALLLGLLLAQVVQFAVAGKLLGLHGDPYGKSSSQVFFLCLAACLFLALVVPLTHLRPRVAANAKLNHTLPGSVRLVSLLEEVCSMAAAWCLMHCSGWFFWHLYHDVEPVLANMAVFLFAGVVGFISIFGLDYLGDHHLVDRFVIEELISAVGFMIGLSWEQCLNSAVHGLHAEDSSPYLSIMVYVALVAMVAPAWAWYILPKSHEALHQAGRHHHHGHHDHDHGHKHGHSNTDEHPISNDGHDAHPEKNKKHD